MAELLSAAQMRAIEAAAIGTGTVTGLELMERAGRGVVDAVLARWPALADEPRRAVVLCGPGNNGGDGFVIARLLVQEHGWQVDLSLLGDPGRLPPDAAANHTRWCGIGPCHPLTDRSLGTVDAPPDLVFDALFGTGLARGVDGDAGFLLGNLEMLRADFGVRCVAVDIPSGLCSDTGRDLGNCPAVDLTVSFHAEKRGHRLSEGPGFCGHVTVADIGLPHDGRSHGSAAPVWLAEAPTAELLAKSPAGHKYDHGHALVMTGGPGHTGAARLAARAALRVGAGLVTLAVPPEAQAEVAGQITALMMLPLRDADALTDLLWDTRLNALCLGPGLGLDARARSLVEAVLPLRRAAVLDADALSLFRGDPAALFDLLHPDCVLTPHGGEFARLFPDLAGKMDAPGYSRIDAVRDAARRAGCVVLLKGPDTVIATPGGDCAVHSARYDRAAPWLATAGAGDVLAGLICGLIARGLPAAAAAETAAWLHVETALAIGPGLIAEDLPEALPAVLAAIGA
ncbi:NAD(P)H-hydrate dehydratase [Pukyongiella litopenaei]|uniref:Bifunctional NAD(P)H-hydrate repair enzyme n=1 Tax=Pukyongiella litopenaei TaxID=2605946 RepID=A0A2S0MNH0_9RHOB|nr:NAD(P)H-hydrate dehydratase [Pukyongiella litopenaei]AVO37291.1 NAD(P)H-hydrate dehydratase [Pukyongiella litopenaei]